MLRTDPVVCPDCNIEDSLSSNMRREIGENTAYIRSVFCFRIQSFQGFRVLGLSSGKYQNTGPAQVFEHVEG